MASLKSQNVIDMETLSSFRISNRDNDITNSRKGSENKKIALHNVVVVGFFVYKLVTHLKNSNEIEDSTSLENLSEDILIIKLD